MEVLVIIYTFFTEFAPFDPDKIDLFSPCLGSLCLISKEFQKYLYNSVKRFILEYQKNSYDTYLFVTCQAPSYLLGAKQLRKYFVQIGNRPSVAYLLT